MKHRIIFNGQKYKIQFRTFLMFIPTWNDYTEFGNDMWFSFDTIEQAKKTIKILEKDEKRTNWKVVRK